MATSPNKPTIIKANKEARINKGEWHHANMIIIKGVVVKDTSGNVPRPATTEELEAAKQK